MNFSNLTTNMNVKQCFSLLSLKYFFSEPVWKEGSGGGAGQGGGCQPKLCSEPGKQLRRKLPILTWYSLRNAMHIMLQIMPRLPHYTLAWAVSDLIAGTTVGLTIIPQVFTSKKIDCVSFPNFGNKVVKHVHIHLWSWYLNQSDSEP